MVGVWPPKDIMGGCLYWNYVRDSSSDVEASRGDWYEVCMWF